MSLNPITLLYYVRRGITAIDASGALNTVGDFSVATNKLTVAAASGNTAVAGTLGVTGNVAVATNKFNITAASGNTAIAGTLGVTGNVAVNTDKFTVTAASGNTTVGGTLAVTGDVAAAGGFRMAVGPFTAPGAAGVVAAGQTNLDCRYEHTVTAAALSFIAPRAGSVMGLSGHISAAITGAGTAVTVKVTVNGTELVSGPELSFTQAGGEVTDYAVAAKDAHAFSAGDIIGVSYTSTAISNTPALVATVEIEC